MSKETFSIEPIGVVQSTRKGLEDDYWGDEVSCISLTSDFSAESLQGLTAFSHIEVFYLFHRVLPEKIVTAARHPRNNPAGQLLAYLPNAERIDLIDLAPRSAN